VVLLEIAEKGVEQDWTNSITPPCKTSEVFVQET